MSPRPSNPPGAVRCHVNRFQRAFRATLVDSGFAYASQALSLCALPLYLATLGAEGYGLMLTVLAFIGYLNFADAGLSWGSMVLIAHAHGQQDREKIAHITRHSVVLAAGSGLVALLFLAGILGASALGWRLPMFARHPEADPLILIVGLQLILTLQFGVFYNVFKGLQETYWPAFYQGLSRILGLAGSMMAAWLTHSVKTVMLVQLIVATLAGIAASIHVWHRHRWAFRQGSWTDWGQYAAQVRVGGKTFLIQIGQTPAGTAPVFGISAVLGPASVPFFTVPVTLLTLFFTPVNSWAASMQNAFGEAWTAGATDWIRHAFRRTTEQVVLITGFGVALFAVCAGSFIQLWTHGRLSLVPWMGTSVAAIVVTSCLVRMAEYLLIGLNRHRHAAMAEITNGILAMFLVPLSVRWLGLGAVGAGSIIAIMATSAWVVPREIVKYLGPGSFPAGHYVLRVALALGIAVGLSELLPRAASPSSGAAAAVHLVLGAVCASSAFALSAFALRLFPYVKALFRRPPLEGSDWNLLLERPGGGPRFSIPGKKISRQTASNRNRVGTAMLHSTRICHLNRF